MFRRAIRLAGVPGLAALALMALISPASAESGSLADDDDTDAAIDIELVTHADSADTITYTLKTYDDWDPADTDGYVIQWFLFVDEDDDPDACVVVVDEDLDFQVNNCLDEVFDQGSAVLDEDTNTVTVAWEREALEDAGIGTNTAYRYGVVTFESEPDPVAPEPDDFAPDEGSEDLVLHQLDGDGGDTTTTTTAEPTTTTTTTTGETTTTLGETTTTTIAGVAGLSTAPPATPVTAQPNYTG